VKCKRRETFVIVGYLNPASRRKGLGALLLGTFAHDGSLQYAGRVGSGFSAAVEAGLLAKLNRIEETKSGVAKVPSLGRRDTHWVRPELVAEIEFP
jgi:bifunctional non-homologous end joining protein LigD